MARDATGIDVGTSGARILRGHVEGTGFVVTGYALAPNPGHDAAGGWEALRPGFRPRDARVGLTGRDVNVRYTRVPRVADWQLRKLMRFEAQETAERSESAVASDFNVLPELPEIEGEDVVLLAMAREALLEEHLEGLAALGGSLDAFTPNAIGLYNAFLRFGAVVEETVLVANVGRENTDVVVVRGADLLFARNLSGGSLLFDEALARRFDVSLERAELYKIEEATLRAEGPFRDANQEKARRALLAPAGQVLSLLESAVVFCKTQVKLPGLRLERVLLCGGGARLDGLREHLSAGLGVPVELFDPFDGVDASRLDDEALAALEEHRLESAVALGLAATGSDPRAYSIEILPERLRRRRELVHGHAWLALALVLALVWLGFFAWSERGRLQELEARSAVLEARLRGLRRSDQETRALLEENERLASLAGELHALAASGEGIVRSLDAIERALPASFWLESLTSGFSSDATPGVRRGSEHPIVRVRGRAGEGTDASTRLFQEFAGRLRESRPEMSVEARLSDTATFFTLELSLLGEDAGAEVREGEG